MPGEQSPSEFQIETVNDSLEDTTAPRCETSTQNNNVCRLHNVIE